MNTGKRARLGAGRRGGRRGQEDPRLRPGRDVRGRRRGDQAHPRAGGPRQGGQGGVAAGVRRLGGSANPSARRCSTGCWPATCPTAGTPTCRPGSRTRRRWPPGPRPAQVLNASAPVLPELWGGSADLAGVNNTTMKGADSFGPPATTKDWNANPYGRTLHFGIREHAMGAILSGIVLHGPTRAYGGTFLQFSDYMRGAVRLAALMGSPPSTCGPTTRSASARTAPPTSRSSTWPRCGPSRGCRSSGPATPTRPRTPGGHPGARRRQRPGRPGPDPAGRAGAGGHHRRGRGQGRLRPGANRPMTCR